MYDLPRIRKVSRIREQSECQTKRPDADNQVWQDMNDGKADSKRLCMQKEVGQPFHVSTLISEDRTTLYMHESRT